MFKRIQESGARRMIEVSMSEAKPPRPQIAGRLLSQVAGEAYEDLCRDGAARRTLDETRYATFYLFEFLRADPQVDDLRRGYLRVGQAARLRREGRPLPPNLLGEFLSWLRRTPSRPRRSGRGGRGGVPKEINPGTVRVFLQSPPPRAAAGGLRGEQSIAKYQRTIGPLLKLLGLCTQLRRAMRPKTKLAPVRLPKAAAVGAWWRYSLSQPEGWASLPQSRPPLAQRRRVVLMQALLQLSGMRLLECLLARLEDVDGHWLLLRKTKTTTPRLIYLSGQALEIARCLRTYNKPRQRLLFAELETPDAADRASRFAGWGFSESRWHKLAKGAVEGYAGWVPKKPHQTQRMILSTWIRDPKRRDVEAESLQLGHGGNLVLDHYEAALERLPPLLEPYTLPEIGMPWPKPIELPTDLSDRLYEELRRLLGGRGEK